MASQLELTQKPFIELQIEALCEENRVKQKRVVKFVKELESRLLSIKELNYQKLLNKFLRLPLAERPNSLNADYPKCSKFVPPEKLDVIGGFKTSTARKKVAHVDLAVRIPASCFEKKDIKNQRYHIKRALYLTQLAHLLNGATGLGIIERLQFQYHKGDFLKPVLLITPSDEKLKQGTIFQLFVYPNADCAIKTPALHPTHGNVAPRWFFQDYPIETEDSDVRAFLNGGSTATPTPLYNSSILLDMELIPLSETLSEQILGQESIMNALMSTKIWLSQRDLHHHFSFILSVFVAYLQTRRTIHQNMSSYTIFKLIIKSIISSEWSTKGASYFEDSADKIATFKEAFPVVFLSPSGNLNLCYNITLDLYNRLKHEAQVAQHILDSNSPDTFELLFLKKVEFINKFDVIVHLPKCTKKLPAKIEYLKQFMQLGVFTPRVYSENVLQLVQNGLTDRVILLQQSLKHLMTLNKTWNFKSIPYDPSNETDCTFTFGLLLHGENSLRILDIGPQAETPEAEDFRKFWDPKSQLRLQNGIISETVVWHVDCFSQRRAIIKYILDHALKRAKITNVVVHYTLLERFLDLQNVHFCWKDKRGAENGLSEGKNASTPQKRKNEEIDEGEPIGIGEEVYLRVLRSYNELNKVIRSIDGLKHSINSIQPTSSHLRSTSVFPPLPVSVQVRNKSLKRTKGVALFPENFKEVGKILHIEPVEIMITLDNTGKWPSDFQGVEAAKLEYLLELGESLKEREYSVKLSNDYLDLLYGQFVFRLRVKCVKELTQSLVALGRSEFLKRRSDLEVLPLVHGALDQLYRQKPAFSLTCRLVKRWMSCHLMTDHISDHALDLIVAHLFIHPEPYSEPASSLCGFRRFLMLMSTHNWKELPLMVNFNNQLKVDEINKLTETVKDNRAKYSPLVITTPFDKLSSPWTKTDPTPELLDLLVRICTKGLHFFNKNILENFQVLDELKALFRPNFKTFDLLIKLHSHVVQNFFMSIDPPKNFRLVGKEPVSNQPSAFKVMPIVDLNVTEQYVKLLRDNYDEVAMFFYDKYGQKIIGVIMKPNSARKLEGDLSKFMKGIKQLGTKLVDSVSVVKHNE